METPQPSRIEALIRLIDQVEMVRYGVTMLRADDPAVARLEEYIKELEAKIAKLSVMTATHRARCCRACGANWSQWPEK